MADATSGAGTMQPPDPQKLTITVWQNKAGTRNTEMRATWPEFCEWLQLLPPAQKKDSCRLLKMARFGDSRTDKGALRHDANVLAITGIEGDYDQQQVTPEQAVESLEAHNLKAAIAPTFTSTPEAPRWRVLTPLSCEAGPDQRMRLVEILNGMLGGILANESGTLSQSFYIGVPAGADYTVLHTFDDPEEGYCLDEIADGLDCIRRPVQGASKGKTGGGSAFDPMDDTDFRDWEQGVMDGDEIHPHLVKMAARLVAKSWTDEAIRAYITGLAVNVEAKRGKERADYLKGRELDDAIASARGKGFAPREYQAILDDARAMDEETDPDAIEALVLETRALSAIQQRRVFDALKRQTGMPFSTLNMVLAAGDEDGEGDPDHLTLARQTVEAMGAENVLAAQSFVWWWDGSGVWRKAETRSVRGWIQHHVDGAVDHVSKALVDSVTDLFTTEIFSPDHVFDVGPPEAVNTVTGEVYLDDRGQWDLMPHVREHYRTTMIPVDYDPKAQAPRFVQFLHELFAPDDDGADKAQALLEMIGYTLMAHCRHERFIILVGSGANGKSVLLSVLEALCGSDNVAGVQPSQFGNKFQRGHLHGKLANIVTEIEQGEVIDDAALKGIVSGEPTTVEHKFRDPFQMRPFSTCWFGTNHMPHTRDFSDALFRRALVVEFNQVFKPENGNHDPHLKEKLMAERSGILSLALDAYSDALADGFTMPASSEKARNDWRMEADQVAQFIEDECEADRFGFEKVGEVYERYKTWAQHAGIQKRVALKSFRDRLGRLGYGFRRDKKGRYVTGLRCTDQGGAESWRETG